MLKTTCRKATDGAAFRLNQIEENKMPSKNKHGYTGVVWVKSHQKWRARMSVEGKKIDIGYFQTVEEAGLAYAKAKAELGFESSVPFYLNPFEVDKVLENQVEEKPMEKNDTGLQQTVEFINPILARKYLEKNVTNRSLRESTISQYARYMSQGDWHLSHQGIAFDVHGNLIDGQHRLNAIIQSNTTIQFHVFRGLSEESFKIIDNGLRRTMADRTKLSNEAARTMSFMAGIRYGANKPSVESVLDEYEKYQDVFEMTVKLKNKCCKVFGSSAYRSALVLLLYMTRNNPEKQQKMINHYQKLLNFDMENANSLIRLAFKLRHAGKLTKASNTPSSSAVNVVEAAFFLSPDNFDRKTVKLGIMDKDEALVIVRKWLNK
jgi:hypothetical protein